MFTNTSLLPLSINFRVSLLILENFLAGSLAKVSLSLKVSLERSNISTVLTLPTHDHELSFHWYLALFFHNNFVAIYRETQYILLDAFLSMSF